MRRAAGLFLVLALFGGACGGGGPAEPEGPFDVGSAIDLDEGKTSTTTTSLSSTPGSPTTSASPSGQPASPTTVGDGRTVIRDGIENRSTVEEDGWRIQLTVGSGAEHRTDEIVPIEVVLTNLTDAVRYHEIRQRDLALIVRLDQPDQRVWDTNTCNPTSRIEDGTGGLRAIEPGEDVPFQTEYPLGGPNTGDCRLPPGEYAVFARVAVCPDDALVETPNPGTYRCAEDRSSYLDSLAVPFNLV